MSRSPDKPALRTSLDVYNRIRWDARFDPAQFHIGYQTREEGVQEIPLLAFVPDGEIPWHRVQHFRGPDGIVWDRRTRTDRVFGSGERDAPLDFAPVHTSALALLPPRELWAPIQAIRQQHDRHLERWMPHVNLLYGFAPEADFLAAAARVAEIAASVASFEVALADFGTFDHRASTTLWLRPDTSPPGALLDLQARLQEAFPRCDEQSRIGRGFTPHLSLGQFPGSPAALAAARSFAWAAIRFEAREICLLSRRGERPFEVRHALPLGGAPAARR